MTYQSGDTWLYTSLWSTTVENITFTIGASDNSGNRNFISDTIEIYDPTPEPSNGGETNGDGNGNPNTQNLTEVLVLIATIGGGLLIGSLAMTLIKRRKKRF